MSIYVIEGADNTGKTTLARKLVDKTKGHLLHCTWDKRWDMRDYFELVLDCAYTLNGFQDVVIDRWSPSEWVYGEVFRDGPSFNVIEWLKTQPVKDITFIYCRNDKVIERHEESRKVREEMFESMEGVQELFDEFVAQTPFLNWTTYDFEKQNVNHFANELIS